MLGNQSLALLLAYVGENLYVALGVLIANIEPELIELVG